ncbi:GOLPH3/VPS74 family protein [Dethiobacter alkaliphilus]|uniref:GOLPH3/VPS74 family protein n=1 Tax=Dethiobacter alkaliphilus TaxID=427926 RepID=UPI002226D0B2|nr:GPP34 family phosphoprotein [Dethiobacter alkaliphilus]MCW3489486.1 GPP34 family phosphoprotein [Dethiobacter alkaliphilus]
MAVLTFSLKYLMCALNEKGKIPVLKQTEVITCLVAGAILELLYDGYVALDEKNNIGIVKEADAKISHLQPLFHLIQRSKKKSIKSIAEQYVFSLNNKHLNELVDSIGNSLADGNFVLAREGQGFFKKKTYYIPNEDEVLKIVEKIRAEFLEEGTLNEETVVLGALLHKSGLIKKYFSKFEAAKLKRRLAEIKNSGASSLIIDMLRHIEAIIVVIAIT